MSNKDLVRMKKSDTPVHFASKTGTRWTTPDDYNLVILPTEVPDIVEFELTKWERVLESDDSIHISHIGSILENYNLKVSPLSI